MIHDVTSIIWDWNGTLLDDVDICIDTINYSLGKRDLPLLTREKYRQIFTFPVIHYYKKAGFDFSQNSFDELSREFIDLYLEKLKTADLFPDTEFILNMFYSKGVPQYILSAMEQSSLMASVKQFGIEKFFKRIQGTGDIYAYGKLQNAKKLMDSSGLNPLKTCLIGDTLHDLEVAGALGCPCLLVSAGHQSHKRLTQKHPRVAKNIKGVLSYCNTAC